MSTTPPVATGGAALIEALHAVREPLRIVADPSGRRGVVVPGQPWEGPLHGLLPPLYPEWLGDRSFAERHGTRFPYIVGAMANGITTPRLVIAAAEAGGIGFFGAAGLSAECVEAGIDDIIAALGVDGAPWGANLIHSPNEPRLEAEVAALYLRKGVRRVSASAYMALTPAIVHFSAAGLRRAADGSVVRHTHVFAKISRPEVARRFLEPAPAELLDGLVRQGKLTPDEAALARKVPVAEDITVEADSGGHTDNQPLVALFPVIAGLRDQICAAQGYTRAVRVGAAGGLGSPASVAAAFALGAAYVLTGSVNQACVESGLSPAGRALLATAGPAAVMMAPAADMFELGVEVQVLSRGTMFGVRARRLHELYKRYPAWAEIPPADQRRVEQELLRDSFGAWWERTARFWLQRDPAQVERALRDPRHQTALVFRAYLGLASRWAIEGLADRVTDYQIWCGPAMGAFNAWVKGSPLEPAAARTAKQVAWNLLEGAAALTRAQQARSYGVAVPPGAFHFHPRLFP